MRHTKYALAIMAVIACEGAEKNEVTLPVKPLATSELDAAKQGADDPTRKPGVSVGPHGVALGAKTLARLEPAGFRCSASLPTRAMRRAVPGKLRPVEELAKRAMALNVLFIWAADTGDPSSTEDVVALVESQGLRAHMTTSELAIMALDRAQARSRGGARPVSPYR